MALLGVPGTVVLFDAPPLKPEEPLLLAGLDEPPLGAGLPLAPPLNPEEADEDELEAGVLFTAGLEGFDEFGVVENDPDLEDVEGAVVEEDGVELLRLAELDVLLLPELVAAYVVMGLRDNIRATDINISFLFIISDPSL